MNCANHPEVAAVAFCRTCGKPLCQSCQRPAQGTVFCEEHAVVEAATPAGGHSPYTDAYPARVYTGASPGLAFLLGLLPGVGAIYNAQYVKGLVHVIIFGLLISMLNSGAMGGLEPLFAMITAAFYIYMPFEAYHTASKRQRGEAVDEFSSVMPMRLSGTGFPVAPVLLIALGVLLLLNTAGLLPVRFLVMYGPPLLLIGLGSYMLYLRLAGSAERGSVTPVREVSHE